MKNGNLAAVAQFYRSAIYSRLPMRLAPLTALKGDTSRRRIHHEKDEGQG
jgi:hypothetical protein